MKKIFEYIDFRRYLKDYFDESNRKIPGLGRREFAEKTGIPGLNALKNVLYGKRKIDKKVCGRISDILNHSELEKEYFSDIVQYQQSKSGQSRENYFKKILEAGYGLDFGRIEGRQYDYYSHWYNPVIREIICSGLFNGDYEKLAEMLKPKISKKEAVESVNLLEKLKMIKKKDGKYIQEDRLITTGEKAGSGSVKKFMKKMSKLACDALDNTTECERSVSSCTLFIPEHKIEKIRAEISLLRKRLMSMAESEEKADRVFQVNFQAFPVTRRAGGEL